MAIANRGKLQVCDANTGKPIGKPLKGHEGGVRHATFSPDGTLIVSGDDSGTIHLLNANARNKSGVPVKEQLRPALSLSFSASQIWSLALSPDGSRIAVSSDEGLGLWNAHSGRSIGSLPLPVREGLVFEMAFNPEGSLVGLTGKGSVLLWPGPTMWPELLCSKLTRNVSHKQWLEWVSAEIKYRVQCAGLAVPE